MAKIEVITGPMFTEKSWELIERMKKFSYAVKRILLIVPGKDNRPERNIIKMVRQDKDLGKYSFIQWYPASEKDETEELINTFQPHMLAIDEAEFFDYWMLDLIDKLRKSKISEELTIAVAGLDMDFEQRGFGIMPELMAWAGNVKKKTTVCFHCKQREAKFTYRKSKEKKVIIVGDKELYEARCGICHAIPYE
ncbi:MAG: hypothetical protein Q8Q06_00805 [bacterium]|nr:hypothetical protein [bacterium]